MITRSRILAVSAICVFSALSFSARAELAADVAQFLADYDRLVALRAEIAADRDAMAADLDSGKLERDVKRFFADRAEAFAVRLVKAADRKQMKIDLNFKPAKLEKPVPGTGDLLKDASSYINSYDAWAALWSQIEQNISQMRNAVASGDNAALTAATTDFFNNHRSRLQKRLQWQSDIKAMKKDVSFKGTGKPLPPPGTTLKEHVAEFLNDRAAWEALGSLVEADRNNLRAALGSPDSLQSTVNTFLTDRRARHVKAVELAVDRKAMRKDVGLSAGSEKDKPGATASSRSIDNDDEDGALDQSADGAGEK